MFPMILSIDHPSSRHVLYSDAARNIKSTSKWWLNQRKDASIAWQSLYCIFLCSSCSPFCPLYTLLTIRCCTRSVMLGCGGPLVTRLAGGNELPPWRQDRRSIKAVMMTHMTNVTKELSCTCKRAVRVDQSLLIQTRPFIY